MPFQSQNAEHLSTLIFANQSPQIGFISED